MISNKKTNQFLKLFINQLIKETPVLLHLTLLQMKHFMSLLLIYKTSTLLLTKLQLSSQTTIQIINRLIYNNLNLKKQLQTPINLHSKNNHFKLPNKIYL